MEHWTDREPFGSERDDYDPSDPNQFPKLNYIPLPFNIELFCRENDERLAERDELAAQVTQLRAENSGLRHRYEQFHDTMNDINVHMGYPFTQVLMNARAQAASPGVPRIENLVRAARDIADHCCGYSPEHLGADNYADPGIKMAQEIIGALRKHARDALAEYERGGSE